MAQHGFQIKGDMIMIQENIPYEFLVRWDHKTGALIGAHVKVFATIKDDIGAIIMQQEGDAQAVAMAGSVGFPLDTIMTAVQTGAIIAMDEAVAARQVAEASLTTTQAALNTSQTRLAEAQASLDKANALLAKLLP